MKTTKIKTVIGAGLAGVIMHSFCCILPIVVFFGGASGLASTLSWIEPAEPYLMAFSFAALSIAFYQVYKPKPSSGQIDCACEEHNHSHNSFLNSKTFLWATTIFTVVMYGLHHFTDVLGHVH